MDVADVPRISPQELKKHLAAGDHPLILDVRRHPDSTHIPEDVHYDPDTLIALGRLEPDVAKDRLIVPYCA